MISEKEEAFIQHWERVREPFSHWQSKLMRGLPMALLFGLPIILSVVVVRLFSPDWYMKMSKNSPGAFLTAVIAMLVVVLFYAIFRMHYKWEVNEQAYQEILNKKNNSNTKP